MMKVITLAHGAGGKIAQQLIHSVMVRHFGEGAAEHDQARLTMNGSRIAMTTDSFVISPRQFPGGDIGCLSIYGTVNDLAVGGALPQYISCAFIIEEGFSIDELDNICHSMRQAADRCKVSIVTGDTKVVPKGQCEGIFINTTGIGTIDEHLNLSPDTIKPGDQIIVSGDIGRHATSIASLRNEFGLDYEIPSDCAPLHEVCMALLDESDVRYMRDATRGGVAAVLNELADSCRHKFTLTESSIPVSPVVKSVCELLGYNPLHLANEGRMVAIVSVSSAQGALQAIRNFPQCEQAAIIGQVSEPGQGVVTMKSYLGVETLLAAPAGELLPRIC